MLNEQSNPDVTRKLNTRRSSKLTIGLQSNNYRERRLIPAVLLCGYVFYLWAPPIPGLPELTWYLNLGFAAFIFLIYGQALTIKGTKVYWLPQVLSFIAAFLSLLRTPDFSQGLFYIVALGVNFFSFLLLIPAVSSPVNRKWMLVGLVMAALGWVVVIQRELAKYGILTSAYQFSGEGNDKNYIALVLGASAITLYTLALLWKPKTEGRQLTIALARLVLITLSLILLYHIFLTYSRSGAITAILAYILTTWLIYSRKHGFARMLVILVPIALLFYFLVVPRLLKQAPTWESYQDISRLGARPALIQKGLAIVRDNPFIGIGIGNSNNHYQSGLQYYPRGLPHNMYLTNWAELGLLSLVGFIYIFYALLKMFRDHYYQFPIPDKIWVLLFVPVSIMALTLDIGGIFNLMTVILAGMYQQQYISSPPKTARAAFPTQLQDVNVP